MAPPRIAVCCCAKHNSRRPGLCLASRGTAVLLTPAEKRARKAESNRRCYTKRKARKAERQLDGGLAELMANMLNLSPGGRRMMLCAAQHQEAWELASKLVPE